MARTGIFAGFYFDPEVFSRYMQEQSYIANAILASGIIVNDPTVGALLGTQNNVGTMPFHLPIDAEITGVLNHNGLTDNIPIEIAAGKQTFMSMFRMRAWKETTFRTDLVGTSGLQNIGNQVADFWAQVWQSELVNILHAVVRVAGMETHITDISAGAAVTPSEANKIGPATVVLASQKALGDMARRTSLVIMHSTVYANLQALNLIEFNKFTIAGTIMSSLELPTFNGRIVIEDDRGTVDMTDPAKPVYKTFIVGRGAFIGAPKQVDTPYYVDYDPEKNGGVNALYSKQARIIHPNGFSLAVDNIVNESPTFAEMGTVANWSLRFNHKNAPIIMVLSNG